MAPGRTNLAGTQAAAYRGQHGCGEGRQRVPGLSSLCRETVPGGTPGVHQDHEAAGLMADTLTAGTQLAPMAALDQVYTDLADEEALQ